MLELQPTEVAHGLLIAQTLFANTLAGAPEGEPGRQYLARRTTEVPLEFYEPMGLGFATPGYSHLLLANGVSAGTLRETGLISQHGNEVMANRVTFPWLSMAGRRILGIGGRKLGDTDPRPKYENSPASPWFSKGRTLYGLTQAAKAIHTARWALLVEGPFDAGSCWMKGYTNCAATVGAKVTLDQLLLLARLCDSVVVLLDNDTGGQRGRSALSKLMAHPQLPPSLEVLTGHLEGAKDPDDATPEQIMRACDASLPLLRPAQTAS